MPRAMWTPLEASGISTLLILVHALGSLGCSSDEGGIGGGSGSGGGGGGPPLETSMLRVAHVAVGSPAVDATALDFTVVDEGSFNGVSFGRVTQPASLRTAVHQVRVTEPGGEPSLANVTWELEPDVRYTVVAYRESNPAGTLGLFVFDEGIDDLEMGHGRVLIGHGADGSAWPTLHVVDSATNEIVANDLMPAEQSQPIDLEAGEYELGFSISSPPPTIDAGPFLVDVAADETTVLILVDTDASDGGILFVLEPVAVGMIPSIPVR